MIMLTHVVSRTSLMARLLGGLLVLSAAACSRQEAPAAQAPAAATGPVTIDIVRVVEQPLDVRLSLPGELVAYESVAVHPRVSGFVKAVAVDRGSVVRQGDLLVTLDAPEIVAQRAEAQSKRQAAEAQLAAARARADSDTATFDRLTAASATPGVVAGNDVAIAGKAADASRSQVVAAELWQRGDVGRVSFVGRRSRSVCPAVALQPVTERPHAHGPGVLLGDGEPRIDAVGHLERVAPARRPGDDDRPVGLPPSLRAAQLDPLRTTHSDHGEVPASR